MKLKVLVAIPAYNCEKQISRVISGFDEELLNRVEKVIVIDDRGKDKTAVIAQKAIDELGYHTIEVVQNTQNLGLGGTHKMAFLYGEKMLVDYVAILHGDNQAKTQELSSLLNEIEKDPDLGAVLGCRFMKGSKLKGYDWKRIWGNRLINWVYSLVSLRSSKDLGSGLNVFRLKDLADHRYLGFDDRMTFNIDLLLDYFHKKVKLKFIPITWVEEDQVTNARNMDVASRAIKQLLRWRLGMWQFTPQDSHKYTSSSFRKSLK